MEALIPIRQTNDNSLKQCIASLGQVVFLGKETRTNHTATYPMHNRYFSNGDKPWVILVNLKNDIKLIYDEIEYIIHANEFVCFDDNIPHAWEMNSNDLEIYYYRAKSTVSIKQGTYCIDGLSVL